MMTSGEHLVSILVAAGGFLLGGGGSPKLEEFSHKQQLYFVEFFGLFDKNVD